FNLGFGVFRGRPGWQVVRFSTSPSTASARQVWSAPVAFHRIWPNDLMAGVGGMDGVLQS
ncbi:MAG TPA: hypothetical protein VFC07_05830, partial [Verrucomicrobiae bacterium]|nr:hypothetical protein [Verrucomicrobiae bacterium]